jgi:hypothetical protein
VRTSASNLPRAAKIANSGKAGSRKGGKHSHRSKKK